MSTFKLVTTMALAGALTLMTTGVYANNGKNMKGRGAPGSPVVYVSSQGLFFDSFVVADLPFNGTTNFQQLLPGVGPSGLQTEFGPGDTGYYGGRWWIDVNEDGYMDDGDTYFLCPLLGPGRAEQ